MNNNCIKHLISIIILVAGVTLNAQTPAFPGAEGGGMYTTGGRGGSVYYVTSLDDTNMGNSTTREGTLRWCLGQSGKRTILFKVSGIINMSSRISIKNGDVTIAGQTAPGDGICLKGYDVTVDADNVIIRYLRFRLGDVNKVESDAIWGRNRSNIMLDHCSMSWSVDECASFYSNQNFTMQWCLLSESLRISIHGKGTHGYGGLWGGKHATFHHNLLAHHDSRNPRYNGWKRSGLSYNNPFDEERMDYRNNVIYNWGANSGYGGEAAGKYNVVNNYFKPGPATSSGAKARLVQIDIDKSLDYNPRHGLFYLAGNVMHNNATVTNDNRLGVKNNTGFSLDACLTTEPYTVKPITQHTAAVAYERVLAHVGASLKRDTVDRRVVREVSQGTYTFTGSNGSKNGLIDTQSDVGGWPTYASTEAPADSNRDGIPDGWLETNYPGKTANQLNEEGYTYLEVYLNSLVQHITDAQLDGGIYNLITTPKTGSQGTLTFFFEPGTQLIRLAAQAPVVHVAVYKLDGQQVRQEAVNRLSTLTVSAHSLEDGIYLIRVAYANGEQASGKLMINNL
ncbi:MAG: T9SS type A sorting domain-containing protein [Bacteroidales bacterium]|nr:T9SS type A sorting domain-containing protein [Bacteroidales bacterium]